MDRYKFLFCAQIYVLNNCYFLLFNEFIFIVWVFFFLQLKLKTGDQKI